VGRACNDERADPSIETRSSDPMNHTPIELGTILFTLVEPHKGHEVAYNR